MKGYYLESKGRFKGLLVSIDSEISCTLTFSFSNALRFETAKEANQFLIEHNFKKHARVIKLEF